MLKHALTYAGTFALLTLLTAPAFAAIPATVLVEGALHSAGGGPVADGVYKITFSIYDKAKDGSAAWTEGPVSVQTTGGRFSHMLGSDKPIDAGKLAAPAKQWLGLKVGSDPELARTPMQSVAFALVAGQAAKLGCSGCVQAQHVANGAIPATKVGFAYAASDTKGGPALKAKTLDCTGCVKTGHLSFDKDVDLKGKALTAGKLTSSGDIAAAGVVAAKQFVGDGSKLTGIKTPAGTCKTAGEVVKGINPDGSLICVKAMDPAALPADGLDKISGNTLGNRFNDVLAGGTDKPIPDFDSNGLLDIIDVPDIGKAESFEVHIDITKAPFVDEKPKDGKPDWDPTDLTVFLFPPTTKTLPGQRSILVNDFLKKPSIDGTIYPHYVLHQGTGGGTLSLVGTWPTKTKEVKGDIHKDWLGKNPKGKWRLMILDNGDRVKSGGGDEKVDGKLVKWTISMKTLSGNQVLADGDVFVNGKIWGKYQGHGAKELGGTLVVGGNLQVNGAITSNINEYVTVGGKKMWYGMFADGSRPFLYGFIPDAIRGNDAVEFSKPSYAWSIPDDNKYLRYNLRMELKRGDRNGNFVRQQDWLNSHDSTDEGQQHIAFWVKNTTDKDIKTYLCYRMSSRGSSAHMNASISLNKKEIYRRSDGVSGGSHFCSSSASYSRFTFPAKKTSFVVLKCGGYYYHGQYNWYHGKYTCGFTSSRLGAANLPKGLEWDYKRFFDFVTY